MKKIYILTAVFALLTLSLNAQTMAKKAVCKQTAPSMKAPNRAATPITVCDGTATNSYLPFWGLYFDDNYQIHQMIYPESLLTDLAGKTITSITFYANSNISSDLNTGRFTFKIGTTNQTSFGSTVTRITTGMTAVATNMLMSNCISGSQFVIDISNNPFTYESGNLVLDYQLTTLASDYETTTFLGESGHSNASFYSRSTSNSTNANGVYSNVTRASFLPKVSFTYIEEPSHDLAITLSEPAAVVAGETATITATVTNNGNQTESGYTVTFGDGTTTFPTQTGGTLNPGDTETFTLNYPTSAAGTVTITANVAYNETDATPSDNSATTNLTVNPQVQDLGISLSAPASVVGGNSATVTATVTNTGNQPMTGYTVTITDGTNTLLTQTVNEALAPGATATFDATYATTEAQVGTTVTFTATVACTGDEDATNNSATASTEVITLPPPENVQAAPNSQNQTATVTWEVPSNLPTTVTTVTEPFTEDFENGTTGWTFIDNDGDGYNWTWSDNSTSNMITNSGDCIVYSESYHNNESGSGGTILYPDNWMISPEVTLDGTLSLYACGQDGNGYHNEVFGVYVCVGSYNGLSSFQQVGSDVTTTHTMMEYTYDLSSYNGQLGHIAIVHHNVNDQFILNIDDVTYQVTNTGTVTLAPVSYNVYLDGQLVGNVDANTFSHTINNVTGGNHTAEVSAVYPGNIESAKVATTFYIQPKTDPPTFSVATGETAYTITANAPESDPNATVIMTVNGQEYTGTGSVSVTIDRGTTDQSIPVSATAQASGKLVSDPATQNVNVPMLPITPDPTITYTTTNGTVVVTANGEGTITLTTSDGQTVTGEGPVSITIVRSLEDRTITATASAVATNHQPSGTTTESVPVPALSGTPIEPEEGLLRMHLLIVDQMKEDIPANNSHPDRYGYVLKWEQPANADDRKQSGIVDVEIKKTEGQVNGYYTKTQVDNDFDHDNSEITLNVLSANVRMELPAEDPDVLYYEMQSTKDALPALGEDYITQLQYMKNIEMYEEMLETSPNKGHHYSPEEGFQYTTPIETGDYGVNFITYAPLVSTWGIQRRYFEIDGLDNTYGAPIWKTGVGQVRMINTEAQLQRGPQGSTQWDGVGGPCSLVFLGLEAYGDLPMTGPDYSNIIYEPYMFRVWIQSPGNNLRGCTLIPEDTNRPERPGEHWEGDGTCYGAEPILIYQGETTDGHLYIDVQEPPQDNQPWASRIQFGALDAGLSDLIVYVRFYYRSTGEGINEDGSKYMLRGNRDGEEETPEVPEYYATEDSDNPDITTGIMELWNDYNYGEVVSTTYVNSLGMQSDQPFDGVNIVVTRYSDGKVRTTKVIR